MNENLLSIQDAAKYLGVSPTTLRRWEEKKILVPFRTAGNQRRYSKNLLDEFKKNSLPNVSFVGSMMIAAEEKKCPSFPASLDTAAPKLEEPKAAVPQEQLAQVEGGYPVQATKKKAPIFAYAYFGLALLTFLSIGSMVGERIVSGFHQGVLHISSIRQTRDTLSSRGVLGTTNVEKNFILKFNVPGLFNKKVSFLDDAAIKKSLEVSGVSNLKGGIDTHGANINAGKGKVTGSNLIYSIVAGSNVIISGDPQNPTVSANTQGLLQDLRPNIVSSVQGQRGEVLFVQGKGITLNGLEIANTGVLSIQGEKGDISFSAGSGIGLSGLQISNTDPGSAQKIFKTFDVGGTAISAETNNDVISFAAGSGIVITPDGKKITIAVNNISGQWEVSGNDMYYMAGNIGIGTETPDYILDVTGTARITDGLIVGGLGTGIVHTNNGVLSSGLLDLSTEVTSVLGIPNGGTGINITPQSGQILIGNGSGYSLAALTAGSGIGITNGSGSISITNNGVLSLTGTANQITASGSTGAITLSLPQDIHTAAAPTFASLHLTSNTDQLTLGTGTNTGIVTMATLTSGRIYTLPDASGEICLSVGNCPRPISISEGNGSPGYVPRFQTADVIENSIMYDTGTKIGIGTTSPTGLFSVSGTATSSALVSLNETGGQNILTGSALGTTRFVFDNNGNLAITGTTGYSASGDNTGLTFSGLGNHVISASQGELHLGTAVLDGPLNANNKNITGVMDFTAGGTVTLSGFTTNGGLLYTNGSGQMLQTTAGTNGQLLIGQTGGAPLYRTISGDVQITNTGITTIQADSVALGPDTTGDYIASMSAGSGISLSGLSGEGSTATVAVDDTVCRTTGNCAGTATGGIGGGGTAGTIALFTGAGTSYTVGNSVLTQSGTVISVGGSVSSTGDISSGGNISASGTVTGSNISGTNTGDVTLGGSGTYLTLSGQQIIRGAIDLANSNNVTGILPDSNISDTLTIGSGSTVEWTALNNYPGACLAGQAVTQIGDTITCSGFASSSDAFINNGNSFGAPAILGTNDNNTLSFETNNTTRMTIDTAGYVGIGTSTPQDIFVVSNGTGELRFGGGNGRTLSAYESGSLSNFDFEAELTYFNSDFLLEGSKKISTDNSSTENLYLTTNDPTKSIYTDRSVSISGSLKFNSGAGEIQTTSSNLLTIGGDTTGDISFMPGNTNTLYLASDGKVGVGTTTPSTNLHVVGGARFTGLSTAGIVTNDANGVLGTTATIPVVNGGTGQSSYAVGDLLVGAAGNTLNKLTIGGNNTCLMSDGTTATWGSCLAGTGSAFVQNGNSFGAPAILGTNDNNTLSFETNNTTRMTIDTSGHVGIGTTTPVEALHIASGTIRIGGLNTNSAVYTDANRNLTTTAPTSGTIGYWSRTGTNLSLATAGDDIYLSGTSLLGVGYDPTTITGASAAFNGSVGIGTTSPNYPLQVGSTTSTSDQTIRVVGQGKAGLILEADTDNVDESDTAYIRFSQDAGTHTAILGQNTATGFDPLNTALTGALSNAMYWGTGLADELQFGTNNVVRMTVDASGNLGLGTNAPSTRLHVVGGARFTGLSTAGIVTNDANGVLGTTATIPVANGGTGQSSYAVGDLLVGAAGNTLNKLTIGGNNTCLMSNGTTATWGSCLAGGGSAFVQNGNSFGTEAVLGTNDTNTLSFETNNTTRMTIGTTGNVSMGGQLTLAGDVNQSQLVIKSNSLQTTNNPFIMLQDSTGAEVGRINAVGGNNFFFGRLAGNALNGGLYNAAVGAQALENLTTGYQNIALGEWALHAITTGADNIAIGADAMGYTGLGVNDNVGIGTRALMNVTGNSNLAVGYEAGYKDSGGSFIQQPGLNNSGAIGTNAIAQASNALVLGSIDLGTKVGIGTTIPQNIFSVSPVNNTGTAAQSGNAVTGTGTGWTSAMIGMQFIFETGETGTITDVADANHLTLNTSQTVPSRTYRIHNIGLQVNSSGNVGIGTTTPESLLELRNDVSGGVGPTLLLANKFGDGNANGASQINFALDASEGLIEPNAQVKVMNIGPGNATDLAFSLFNGATLGETVRFKANGNVVMDTNTLFVDAVNNRVGIGTASPSTALHVVGGATFATATATDDLLSLAVTAGGAGRFTGTLTNLDLTAAQTWRLPNLTGTIALTSNNQTFTNTQTFSGTLASTGTTNITGASTTIGDALGDTLTIGATVLGASPLTLEGSTVDANDLTLAVANPTAARTITFPNASGTVAISASGNIALDSAGNITFTGTLPAANGGTGQTTYVQGDLLIGGASANTLVKLAKGTTGQCLTSDGTTLAWGSCGSGAANAFVNAGNSFGAIATLGTNDAYNLQLETGGTTRMTLDTTGKVGIGTLTPRTTLDLGADGSMLTIGGTTSGGRVNFGTATGGNSISFENSNLGLYTSQPNGIRFYTNVNDDGDITDEKPEFTIDYSGNLMLGGGGGTTRDITISGGINTTNNTSGGNITFDATMGLGTGSSGDIIFRTANTTSGSYSSVVLDTNVGAKVITSSTPTWSHTVTTQSNRLIIVSFTTWTTVSGVTYGGDAMTLLPGSNVSCGGACRGYVYFKVDPKTGLNNVVVSQDAASTLSGSSTSFYSVNTGSPFGAIQIATGTTRYPTTSVATTNDAYQMVYDSIATNGSNNNYYTVTQTALPAQQRLWEDRSNSGTGGSWRDPAASSTTMGWDLTSGYNGAQWVHSVMTINPYQPTGSIGTLQERVRITAGGEMQLTLGSSTNSYALCHETNGSGMGQAIKDCSGTPQADYAELYATASDVEYGDLVKVGDKTVQIKALDGKGNILEDGSTVEDRQLVKSTQAYDPHVIGIVSNNYGDFSSTGHGRINDADHPRPVALSGRVPVKIASTSAEIHAGDVLAASSEPGKAMKATRPGQAIGKALEDWSPTSGKATVLTFVNNFYYDPDVYLTDTGDINVVAEQQSPDLPTSYTLKNSKEEVLSRVGVFSDMAIGNAKVGSMSAQKLVLGGRDVEERLSALESVNGSAAAQLTGRVQTLEEKMASLQDKVASMEASMNLMLTGSTLNGGFTASSAAELSIDKLEVNDANISGNLAVAGRTTVADLGVTGNVTAGLLSINGLDESTAGGQAFASINTSVGPLKIQSDVINNVDFMNGKVVFETNGNMRTEGEITVKKINIQTPDVSGASAGTTIFPAGQKEITVTTTALTPKSLIFVTPDMPVTIGAKASTEDTFIIRLQMAQEEDLKVNWWIVN